MNYITHLNAFFERVSGDGRLTAYHISLYLALFRQWNACRFSERFAISRAEMMDLARIGSANTYARCMKELTDWGYICYKASSNLHRGSEVSGIRLDAMNDSSSDTEIDIGTINDTTESARENQFPSAGNSSGIKSETARDTGIKTTGDTGTSADLKNDTAGNTANDTGIQSKTARNTGNDTPGNTGTSCDIKNDIPGSTATDTGIASNRRTDTATDTGNRKNDPAGTESDTGTDTASDTPLIKKINKNKEEENQKRVEQVRSENQQEKVNMQKRRPGKNPKTEEESGIPDFSEVSFFFQQNRFPQSEAQQFYARYLSLGWKTGNDQRIVSWQALARKWMSNSKKNNSHERPFNQIGAGRFSVRANKDYSEPL
nr:hypothetical protein [Sunxiuqinia sp.]